MNFSREVKKNIVLVAAGTFGLGAIMLLLFAVLQYFSLSVLWGALIGCGLAALNFFLLAFSLHKAVDSGGSGKGIAGISYTLRNVMMLVCGILAIALLKVNPVALLLPYVFPRLVILILQATGFYQKEEQNTAEEGDADGS